MADEIPGVESVKWTPEFVRLTDKMKAMLRPGPRLHELGCSDPTWEQVFLLGGPHHEKVAILGQPDSEIPYPFYGGHYRRTAHATTEQLPIFEWVQGTEADPIPEKPETWHDRPSML